MKSSLVENRSFVLISLFLMLLTIGPATFLWVGASSSQLPDHNHSSAVNSPKVNKASIAVGEHEKIKIFTRLKAKAPKAIKHKAATKAIQKQVLKRTRILPTIMARPDMAGTKINLATYYGPKVLDDISIASNNPDLVKVYSRTIKGVGRDYRQKASL